MSLPQFLRVQQKCVRTRMSARFWVVSGTAVLGFAIGFVFSNGGRANHGTVGQRADAVLAVSGRKVYPLSVIPGGVQSRAELARAVAADPVVARHYVDVQLDRVRVEAQPQTEFGFVSFRKNGAVYWTRRRVRISAGEKVLTDGMVRARARCGNQISATPRLPVLSEDPPEVGSDTPLPLRASVSKPSPASDPKAPGKAPPLIASPLQKKSAATSAPLELLPLKPATQKDAPGYVFLAPPGLGLAAIPPFGLAAQTCCVLASPVSAPVTAAPPPAPVLLSYVPPVYGQPVLLLQPAGPSAPLPVPPLLVSTYTPPLISQLVIPPPPERTPPQVLPPAANTLPPGEISTPPGNPPPSGPPLQPPGPGEPVSNPPSEAPEPGTAMSITLALAGIVAVRKLVFPH